jgi:23S rRNA (cytosine1962-C5)-methyltransferase
MDYPTLYLNKNADRRIRAGHVWIYSNEIDNARSPLKTFTAGQHVIIAANDGKNLGLAYVNPQSLLCARIVNRDIKYPLDHSLFIHKLNVALSLRERIFDKPYYRAVYGEGDGLPGLIVDRFGDVLVAQMNTAGMDALKDEMLIALQKVFKPQAIVLRNDSPYRKLEGLEQHIDVAFGTLPDNVICEENGATFNINVLEGQKTGWFYDHRFNRARACEYVQGKRVLDVFSYTGAWGIQAARAGADSVMCIDSSVPALEQAHVNADLNNVKIDTLQGDAFDALKQLRENEEKFDVIILDPPAFIKTRKDNRQGEIAYRRINQMAMQVLKRDGILVSASCSMHLTPHKLQAQIMAAGRHMNADVQLLESGGLGADHPVHPAIPETDYLKSMICRVTR